jgi:hypothetical protein
MRTIQTQITIDATPEAVWDVLTDFDRYHEWNPFVVEACGRPQAGERLELRMRLGRATSAVRPEIIVAEPNRALEWLGAVGRRGIFDGRHRFELAAEHGKTRLDHRETFDGILAGPMLLLIGRRTEEGFEAMNEAVARRVATGNRAG